MLSALFIACLAAAAPGAIVLQVLPRLAASDASTVTQAALGTLLPLAGALLGGLLLRAMTHRSTWVGAALGLAAQAAGVPEFVSIFSGTVALGYLLDTAVYTALFGSYVVLGGALATLAAGPASVPSATMSPEQLAFGEEEEALSSPPVWEGVSRRPAPAKGEGSNLRWWAQVLGAVILLVTAVPTLGNLAAPLLYSLSMSLAAAALAAYASAERAGWQRRAALVALVVAAAVAAFITVLLAGTLAG